MSNLLVGLFSGRYLSAGVNVAGGKTFTVSNTLTIAGTDGSTLNVGTGGTLGTAAYATLGVNGATVPLLNGNNTYSGTSVFSRTINVDAPTDAGLAVSAGSSASTGAYIAINAAANAQAGLLFRSAGSSRWSLYRPQSADDLALFSYSLSANIWKWYYTTGNCIIGAGTAPSGGGQCFALSQASGDPTGIASNTAGLVAKDLAGTCELYAFDEAGVITLLSHGKAIGTSGNTIPLLDGANTWSGVQTIELTGATGGIMLKLGSGVAAGNRYQAIDAAAASQAAITFMSAGTKKFTLYRPGSSDDLAFFNETTTANQLRFGSASPGNIIVGTGTVPSGGGQCFALSQASGNPTGIGSNTAGLVAKDNAGTCELYSWDEAGNVTLISPHAKDGPAWLYDADDPLPRVLKEENVYLGIKRWTNQSRADKLLQRMLAGENIAALPSEQRTTVHEERYTPTEDWDANQISHEEKRNERVDRLEEQHGRIVAKQAEVATELIEAPEALRVELQRLQDELETKKNKVIADKAKLDVKHDKLIAKQVEVATELIEAPEEKVEELQQLQDELEIEKNKMIEDKTKLDEQHDKIVAKQAKVATELIEAPEELREKLQQRQDELEAEKNQVTAEKTKLEAVTRKPKPEWLKNRRE